MPAQRVMVTVAAVAARSLARSHRLLASSEDWDGENCRPRGFVLYRPEDANNCEGLSRHSNGNTSCLPQSAIIEIQTSHDFDAV